MFTDHKPLISMIRKLFDEVLPRLQRWLVALMPYQVTMTHVPGRHLVCADALSRAPLPVKSPTPEEARSMGEYTLVWSSKKYRLASRRFSKLPRPIHSSVQHHHTSGHICMEGLQPCGRTISSSSRSTNSGQRCLALGKPICYYRIDPPLCTAFRTSRHGCLLGRAPRKMHQ